MLVKTWNIQGSANKNSKRILQLINDIQSIMNPNTILLLQDTQTTYLPISFKYELVSCQNLERGGAGGCAIVMGKNISDISYDVTKDPAGRYIAITLHTSPFHSTFISIYLPHYCSIANAKRRRGRYSSICAIHSQPLEGRVGLMRDLMNWTITLNHPIIIGGDFNSSMENVGGKFGKEINRFQLDFQNTRDRTTPPTFPQSGNTLDHIFITPSNLLHHKPHTIQTIETLFCSDHNLVSVEIIGGSSLLKMKPPSQKIIRTNKKPLLDSPKETKFHEEVERKWQPFHDELHQLINQDESIEDWIRRVEIFLGETAERHSQQISSRRKKLGLPLSLKLPRDIFSHIKMITRKPSSLNTYQIMKWRKNIKSSELDKTECDLLQEAINSMSAYAFTQNDLEHTRLMKIKRKISHMIQGKERAKVVRSRDDFSHKIEKLFLERKFKRVINMLIAKKSSSPSLHSIQGPNGHVIGENNTIPLIANRLESISSNETSVDETYYRNLMEGYQPTIQLPPPLLQPSQFINIWKHKKKTRDLRMHYQFLGGLTSTDSTGYWNGTLQNLAQERRNPTLERKESNSVKETRETGLYTVQTYLSY